MENVVYGTATLGGEFMTVEEMYARHPRKWLVVNAPVTRDSDCEILAGELLGAYDEYKVAWYFCGVDKGIKHGAVINSIQEEDDGYEPANIEIEVIQND
jgi:hypothetical protein